MNDSVRLVAQSRLYETPCVPAGAGPDYINAVVLVKTSLNAEELLQHLHQIEADFDRIRTTRWGQRTLDLDLIDFGGKVLPDMEAYSRWRDLTLDAQLSNTPDHLIVPHPRLQDRAFVLVPLQEIAPDWRHPASGISVSEMLSRLDPADITAIKPLP